MVEYTEDELNEFRRLVELGESRNQMDRIESRCHLPKFVEKHGKEKCDAMFAVLKSELTKPVRKRNVKPDGLVISLSQEDRARLIKSLRGLAEALESNELVYKSGVMKVEYNNNDDGSSDMHVTSNLVMTRNRELH